MLHLQAGIHLQKVKGFVLSNDKLHGTSRLVIDGACQGNGLLAHGFAGGWVNKRRWRFFNYLLVTALNRAVTLPQINNISVGIAEYLNLNVPWAFDKLLNKYAIIAKTIHSFGSAGRKAFKGLFIVMRNPQAFTTTTGRCFDHHGVTDVLRNLHRYVWTINRFVKARNRVDLRFHS